MNRVVSRSIAPGVVALIVVAAANACTDKEAPVTGPAPPTPPGPVFATSDAARDVNGVAGFYFLPPMLPEVPYPGTFDPTLDPEVLICEWGGTECGTEIARFTRASGTGGELVKVEDDHYHVNWHTDRFALDAAKTYRIRVSANGFPLGYTDVDLVSGGNELRNVDTDLYIPLLDGRTLPIKFRAEGGIVGAIVIDPPDVVVDVGEKRAMRASVRDLHDVAMPDAPVAWSLGFGPGSTGAAAITGDGEFTAVTPGTGNVTATSGGRSASVPFTVLVPAASIAFQAPIGSLPVGNNTTVTATAYDVDNNPITRPIAYTSSDPSVATVTPTGGVATGIASGAATITATTGGVSATTLLLVYDASGPGITFMPPDGSPGVTVVLTPNQSTELVAVYNIITIPISNLTGYFQWAYTSSSVAVISSEDGLLHAGGGVGTTTITGCLGGLCGSFTVEVQLPDEAPPPDEVKAMKLAQGWTQATANDVNPDGIVVGDATTSAGVRGFRWDGVNDPTELPMPAGATRCNANAINSHGVMVGHCVVTGYGTIGVKWPAEGGVETLPSNATTSYKSTAAWDINDHGDIVGSAPRNYTICCISTVFTAGAHARWDDANKKWITFGWPFWATTPGGTAYAVSENGHIAGQTSISVQYPCGTTFCIIDVPRGMTLANATSRTSGSVSHLSTEFIPPYNTGRAIALGVNSNHVVVGWMETQLSGTIAHVATRWLINNNTQLSRLGIPGIPHPASHPQRAWSEARDVNDQEWIVGNLGIKPFVWKGGSDPAIFLDPLVAGRSARANAVSHVVNGRAYVAGNGVNAEGKTVAVRWPVSSP